MSSPGRAATRFIDGANFRVCNPLFLGIDAGGSCARRLVQRRLAKETALRIGGDGALDVEVAR